MQLRNILRSMRGKRHPAILRDAGATNGVAETGMPIETGPCGFLDNGQPDNAVLLAAYRFAYCCVTAVLWYMNNSRYKYDTSMILTFQTLLHFVSETGTQCMIHARKRTSTSFCAYTNCKGHKVTLAPSGIRRQAPARRRFGSIHTRLRIKARDLQPNPRFVVVE